MGDKEVIQHLALALQDSHWHVRSLAAKALGKIRNRAITPILVKTIDEDEDWHVRTFAIEALGELGIFQPSPPQELFGRSRSVDQDLCRRGPGEIWRSIRYAHSSGSSQ